MAVNSLTFGGIDSANYGIFISGEGVYNAPARMVEEVEVPGRNGKLIIDQGSFENISVSYPAFMPDTTQAQMRANLSNYRNAILSKIGYQRLSDSYHTDEYRMGVYKDGLEVEPVLYGTSAKFTLTFYCKPQRFLTSGETEVTMASGGEITNPTLFDASPLLKLEGYGDIDLAGQPLTIGEARYGSQQILPKQTIDEAPSVPMQTYTLTKTYTLTASSLLETGDAIPVNGVTATFKIGHTDMAATADVSSSQNASGRYTRYQFEVFADNFNLIYGTASTRSAWVEWDSVRIYLTTMSYVDFKIGVDFAYDGANELVVTYSVELSQEISVGMGGSWTLLLHLTGTIPALIANSTKLVSPMYVDLDIGEIYGYLAGQLYAANGISVMPSDLPVLKPGANTITFDNTFTSFKITPRYWKI